MDTIYIVISAKEMIDENQQKIIIYDDSTEMILKGEQLVEQYSTYLKQKFKDSFVVSYPLEIKDSLDINMFLAVDAMNKLSQSELDALKLTLNNE